MNMLRTYLNIRVIAGAVIFALVLIAVTVGLLAASRPVVKPQGVPTAVLNIISAPTVTQVAPMAPPTATPSPVAPTDPAIPSGVIAIGAFVQVTAGADGLRMRAEPGLSGEVRFLAYSGEVYQVTDGPRQGDGYTWWYMVDPYDQNPQGWAVQDYLAVIQNP
ncbi:MAG: hypothetical protein JW726_04220 [Anaerolineales bacterium]|nr:hypothetical protein [Anaerolineales bacterium]